MIEKLKQKLTAAKYITLTLTDLGDQVQITATIRPKDGSDAEKPVQVKADYMIADSMLISALLDPPEAGKEKIVKAAADKEESADLFDME